MAETFFSCESQQPRFKLFHPYFLEEAPTASRARVAVAVDRHPPAEFVRKRLCER